MVKFSRKPVSISDLWVSSHDSINDFYLSSWQSAETAVPMLALRLFIAVLATGILVWSVVESPSPYWLTFLTNWGLLLVTSMMISAVIVSASAFLKGLPETGKLPWYFSMYWFFYNVSIPIALVITALYWGLLYSPSLKEEVGDRLFWLEISTHGLNSVLAVSEFILSRTPLYLVHVYQPLGVALWYAIFSFIYYAAGGTDGVGNPFIYEILDWRQSSRAAVVVCLSIFGLVAIYVCLWGVALGRERLSNALVRTTSKDLDAAPVYEPRSLYTGIA